MFRLRHSTKTDHRTGAQGRIVLLVKDAVELLRRRKAAWEASGIAETGVPAAGAVFAHPLDRRLLAAEPGVERGQGVRRSRSG